MSHNDRPDHRRPYNYEVAEDWKEWVGRPWPQAFRNRALGGCYQVVRDFYKHYYDRDLFDYPATRKYLFENHLIEEEVQRQGGAITVYKGTLWEPTPIEDMELGDVMIMRLFYDRLEGGYTWKEGKTCNHCGIYLGDGFMLHQPAHEKSQITDIIRQTYWGDNTEVVLRLRDRKNIRPYIKT
jgi:hypothetical protein|tara:strand:- start:159 stop:704 length:546 start_codon:yes stop_codon:yes gene_type:complete